MYVDTSSSSSSDILSGLPGLGGPPSRVRKFRYERWSVADKLSSAVSQGQPAQAPIKFDVPASERHSAASWLTWSQSFVYQARAYGFETEQEEGLSVEADVFEGSNVDPVTLRNAYVACMVLINSGKGMVLEIVQRSEISIGAWREEICFVIAQG